MAFLTKLNQAYAEGRLSEKVFSRFFTLYTSYAKSVQDAGLTMASFESIFDTFFIMVEKQIQSPHLFLSFNPMVRTPLDYHLFSIDFLIPLIKSLKVFHIENVEKINAQVKEQENVILFANHQSELDPPLIKLALENYSFGPLAQEMIFVAGDRVTTDPLAVPFSLGCNLLCIYSKRHIETPIEKKGEKLAHNQRTMQRMKELLAEGGKCIYVAPSGGRDRPNEKGEINVSPFDPQSIEMFRLMAQHSKRTTHFYPLALVTYDILPPPRTIETEIGEERNLHFADVSFSFGKEIEMEQFASGVQNKHLLREVRSQYIWKQVQQQYLTLIGEKNHV